MPQTFKFLVVDDHPMIRDSMADALAVRFPDSIVKKAIRIKTKRIT